MLTAETKRHIDAARQVLVGVVPNPAAQIDQITNALIYKSMDDMDQQAILQGDKPHFFVGELENSSWRRLMDSKLGNQERMNLYAEALLKFREAKKFPELFRDIFREAYLPFRSPDVLYLFLKEIDYLSYSHSEELGNAYEYLLSILSAQGDAGQFRTPRHIIDFIVDVVDPDVGDTILDPACGTGGFLISAYKHIQEKYTEVDKKTGKNKSTLTPDQRRKLMESFQGYDIDSQMAKLSRVNMYLHNFKRPKIYEYDTLTREERWNDNFSVILANPPFMSPKGGIMPNPKFGIKSSRSEVLFVQYFIDHLKPSNGRAGMIVPEGIIFQSGSAHRQIRENLIKDGLYAVVSLPAGVFNPYSGVKTSILFFDNAVVKKTKDILFVKIQHDGYSLGAQRRPIEKNDLPDALNILRDWREYIIENTKEPKSPLAHVISRENIKKNDDLSLSVERYQIVSDYENSAWPVEKVGNLVKTIAPPKKIAKSEYQDTGIYPIIDQSKLEIAGWTSDESAIVFIKKPVVIFGDHTCVIKYSDKPFAQGADGIKILETDDRLHPKFLFYLLKSKPIEADGYKRHFSKLQEKEIPVPPISQQIDIVKQLDSYQLLIDSALGVIENWRPKIVFDSSWPKIQLKDICKIESGVVFPLDKQGRIDQKYPFLKVSDMNLKGNEVEINSWNNTVSKEELEELGMKPMPAGTMIFPKVGAAIATNKKRILTTPSLYDNNVMGLIPTEKVLDKYLYYVFQSVDLMTIASKATPPSIRKSDVEVFEIYLPDIEIQRKIVSEIEKERATIDSNIELVQRYQERMDNTLEKLIQSNYV